MSARRLALLRLISLEEPLQTIQADLAKFPWDSEGELVVLQPEYISALLKRYMSGRLGAEKLEEWASVVEGPMTHLRATLLLGRVERLAS